MAKDWVVIDHFRAHWYGSAEAENSAEKLMINPGRAAGKVAHWSLARMATVLKQYSRRRLDIRQVGDVQPSANERSVLALIEALAADDTNTAHAHAIWLVQPQAAQRLIDRVRPIADLYPQLRNAA